MGGGGGWEVGVGEMGGEGRLEAVGKHSSTNGSAMPSVGDLDRHNSQGRPGLPLGIPYSLINASQGPHRP